MQDHGYGASASRRVLVYSPAFHWYSDPGGMACWVGIGT